MIEIFLLTIAAFSTLAFLTFFCVRNKYDVQAPMIKSNSFQIEGTENGIKIQPRNNKTKVSPKNQPKFNDDDQCFKDKSSDIEKGLLNSNSTNSYSPQRAESDKDSDSSLIRPNQNQIPSTQPNSHTQESVVFANPRNSSKHSHREMALPLPPHLQHIDSNSDQFLQRSQSDVEKSINAQVKANSKLSAPEHPLEKSTSKRSLIPLPSTPNDVIIQSQQSNPPCPILKRGKSQNELDTGPGNVDLGYETLTMDRNILNKRYYSEAMNESSIQANYPRPRHYAQLKKNSIHGSLSDITPPNSARVQRSFEFSPKNTKKRGRAVSIGPESSPFHPPIISTAVTPNKDKCIIESMRPNQYASELKPILSVIINDMNRRTLEDSLSPVDESDSFPNHRHDSSDTSEIHENSIYNLNELLSNLSSPEASSSGQSKKRDTSESSSSSSDDLSIHENNLYESIEGELDRIQYAEKETMKAYSNIPHSVMLGQGSFSEQNNCVFYSELERKDYNQPNQPHSTYYDSITLMRIEDSDESNGSTKASEESNYGKFVKKNSLAIEGLEDYDTLTHFPSTSPKCNNQCRCSPESDVFPSKNEINTPPEEEMKQHQYDCVSDREDETFKSNVIERTRRSIHDYEKINEADLVSVKQSPEHGEIGPF